jgi:hypothetical protein
MSQIYKIKNNNNSNKNKKVQDDSKFKTTK